MAKTHPLVEAYGTVDEANSFLGLAIAHKLHPEIAAAVQDLQNLLFELGADLATLTGARHVRRIDDSDIAAMETLMDAITAQLPVMKQFVLPGGNPGAASLQVARAVIRRAERSAIRAAEDYAVNPRALTLLNRISDYLFLLARRECQLANTAETPWKQRTM